MSDFHRFEVLSGMLGIVFTSFIEMLEDEYSEDFADQVIDQANLKSHGSYKANGYYSNEEMLKLVTTLSKRNNQSPELILYQFGHWLFKALVVAHGSVLDDKYSVFDVLESLDNDIHRWVLSMYPDAALPTFTVLSKNDSIMVVEYNSPRNLYSMAEGLIAGAAAHFGQSIHRTTEKAQQPNSYIFTVTLLS